MTSAPVTDERVHRAVIEQLLEAVLGIDPVTGDPRVYDYGTVPGDENNPVEEERNAPSPAIYVLLTLERRYVAPRRGGLAGRSGWRITCRYVGRTVAEARWAALKVTQAIDEKRLAIGGETSTLVTHESTSAIEPDNGRFSGLAIYTYAL